MAENIQLNAGTGGDVAAADDIGGIKFSRVKLVHGADGVNDGDVSKTNPYPVGASLESSQMVIADVAVTPKFAIVNASTGSADNAIVAAVSAKKIRVLSYVLVADGEVAVTWRNGTSPVSGAMSFGTNGGAASGFCPVGHFETTANTALNLYLSASTGVRGHVTYIEV